MCLIVSTNNIRFIYKGVITIILLLLLLTELWQQRIDFGISDSQRLFINCSRDVQRSDRSFHDGKKPIIITVTAAGLVEQAALTRYNRVFPITSYGYNFCSSTFTQNPLPAIIKCADQLSLSFFKQNIFNGTHQSMV